MIHPENERKLLEKKESVKNCIKFFTDLLEFMKTNENTKQFYEEEDHNFDPVKGAIFIKFFWNTGDIFCLEFIKETQKEEIKWLEFEFSTMKHFWKEDGDINGEKIFNRIHEFQPTGLFFYVKYMGDIFTIKINNYISYMKNDFALVSNQIAKELVKSIKDLD